jgi:hypothetical protein
MHATDNSWRHMGNFLGKLCMALVLIPLAGCANTDMISHSLNGRSYQLAYLHDTNVNDGERLQRVCLEPVTNRVQAEVLPGRTTLIEKDSSFLPLLIYWSWKKTYVTTLGRSSIDGSLEDFVTKSFLEEATRSGHFKALVEGTECDYKIRLSIDDVRAGGPYMTNGHFLFALVAIGWGSREFAGPATSTVRLSAQLLQGTTPVLEKSYQAQARKAPLNKNYVRDVDLLRADFVNSMVEAISYSLKKTIDQLVSDMNNVLL